MENNNKIFADALRKAFLEERGLTQAALVRLLQQPPSTVHNWLSGRVLPRPRLFSELNNQLEGGWPTEVLEAYQSLQKPKAAPAPEPEPAATLVVKLVEETPAVPAEPAAAAEPAATPAAPAGRRSYGRRKIGPWLLQAREMANKPQAEVAAYVGVIPSIISQWEHDKWAPSQAQLEKLKELLGVDFDTRPLQSKYQPEAQADAMEAKEAARPPRRPRLETLLRSCQQAAPNSEIKLNQQALRNLVEVCHGVAQLEERKAALISQLLEPEKKLTARERLAHLADPQEGPLRSISAESGIRSFGQILTTSLAGWSNDDKVSLTGLALSRLTALEQGETPSAQESIKLLQDLGLEAEDLFPCGRFDDGFPELLREILEEAQVSTAEFAKVTGLNLGRVENWLQEETVPNKAEIGIISGTCGLSYNAVWNAVYRPDQPVWEKRR